MRCWLILGLLGITLCSCAHNRYGTLHQAFNPLPASPPNSVAPPSRPQLIVTPETQATGKVVKVNAAGRFVVLSFPLGHLPQVDQRLNVYRQGLKVGEVKISGPQKEDNIVADLVSGNAELGDEVRE
jgi:hypothetical protein